MAFPDIELQPILRKAFGRSKEDALAPSLRLELVCTKRGQLILVLSIEDVRFGGRLIYRTKRKQRIH